ncbi:unnamed protein product, partial [Vitis vinifera]
MDDAKISELKQFVNSVKSDPSILYNPSLSFFKSYLQSLGARIPEKPEMLYLYRLFLFLLYSSSCKAEVFLGLLIKFVYHGLDFSSLSYYDLNRIDSFLNRYTCNSLDTRRTFLYFFCT